MQSDSASGPKTYSPPNLKKLTVEQAMQFLAGPAGCGDRGALDLLELLHPEAQHDEEWNRV